MNLFLEECTSHVGTVATLCILLYIIQYVNDEFAASHDLFPNVRVNMRGVSVLGLVGAVLLATALAQSR